MKNKLIIVGLTAALLGAGGGFVGGMKYQQNQAPAFNRQMANGNFRQSGMPNGQSRTGFRPVNGDIISADDKSITVKLVDGSSKIVLFSDKTQINQAQTVDKAQLKVGVKVAVFGTDNSDGSVTAQNISLNPTLRGPMEK